MSLPYTFRWTPRPAAPTDSYEFALYDPQDGNPFAYTDPPLGYVGSFTLNGLPGGFETYTWYIWEIWAYSPDGGTGVSYESRWGAFVDSGANSSLGPASVTLGCPAPTGAWRTCRGGISRAGGEAGWMAPVCAMEAR